MGINITQRELGMVNELAAMENSLYEKFQHYASLNKEKHIQRLCTQMADRAHQHLKALRDVLGQER